MNPSTLEFMQRATARPCGVDTELVVDNFAGAGGASLGIEAALGRAVDVAINHDPQAIDIHTINHPETRHLTQDIWQVDPVELCAGRPVGLAWFSPDCTHFSRAKGGRPRKKKIRDLAWVVIRWAEAVRPRVIILENVPEFQTWGPLGDDGRPIAERAGETFDLFVTKLRRCGYGVQWQELVAADYGTPTTRKRLFIVARSDGGAIRWPERTHAPRDEAEGLGLRPWRPAADCIDFSLPCPSIFERKRPLAENTMRRIAKGLKRFVLETEEPFIVCCNHGGREFRGQGLGRPLSTITAARDALGLVQPYLTEYHGEKGDETRAAGVDGPLPTQDTSNRFGLVQAFLAKHYGGVVGHGPDRPLGTVTAVDHHSIVQAFLNKHRGTSAGQSASGPLPTITAGDGKTAAAPHALGLTSVGMIPIWLQANNTANGPRSPESPLGTVTTGGRHMLATSHLAKLYGTCRDGQDARDPMPTVTATGNHVAEVRAFLVKYYGSGGGQTCADPMHTLTAKARMGLVEVAGLDWQIVDIGLRMLEPEELLRAQFGRFAKDYVLVGTKARKVSAIGNSVPPETAEALVRANMVN